MVAAIRDIVSTFRNVSTRSDQAQLAHVVKNQTEAAYARSDLFERRRRLMDDWAAYLDGEREQVVPPLR